MSNSDGKGNELPHAQSYLKETLSRSIGHSESSSSDSDRKKLGDSIRQNLAHSKYHPCPPER